MRLLRVAPVAVVAFLLVILLPASASAATVHGTVTNCANSATCTFSFNTTAGTGWANGTPPTLSIQLPGEAKASYNLSYSTYIGSLIGTYTYWTVGNFIGTDVNTGHVILGTTDTNFTITCHGHSGRGGGCTYTYTTDNGTIAVTLTNAEQTATAITCTKTSVSVGTSDSCTVQVTNLWNASNVPTGKVRISAGGLGSISNKGSCTLSAGKCTFKFTPFDNTNGNVALTATYLGTTAFYKGTGSTTVTVTGGG